MPQEEMQSEQQSRYFKESSWKGDRPGSRSLFVSHSSFILEIKILIGNNAIVSSSPKTKHSKPKIQSIPLC